MAIILIFFSIFPSFADQAALLNQTLSKFPPALLAAFGMNQVDLATMLGYFSFIFLFVQLCIAIQAGNYGFGLVSVEETELTADFLVSKPVSRAQILNSKLLAAITSLIVTDIVVWVSTIIGLMYLPWWSASTIRARLSFTLAQPAGLPAVFPEPWAGHLAAGQACAQRDAIFSRAWALGCMY